MSYSKNEIITKCKDAICNSNTFYQCSMLNYRGKTNDTGEYYTEVIAEFIYKNIDVYKAGFSTITRKSSYKVPTHIGKVPSSNREEEMIAIKMYNQSAKEGFIYPFIGRILDYQTPLKSSQDDVAGKIDLLSFDGRTIRILELKKPSSMETMLRCVLEAYTYSQILDHSKLKRDFELPSFAPIEASPLVFLNSFQHNEMRENRKWLKVVMDQLQSKPYYIEMIGNTYTIKEDCNE